MARPNDNWVIILPDIDDSNKVGNLELETSYDNEKYSITKGTVVALPKALYFDKKNKGRSMSWRTEMELEVGDEVYFHYLSSINSMSGENRTLEINGELCLLIRYESIFCAQRGDVVIPINGYLLMDPVRYTREDNLFYDTEAEKNHKNLAVVRYAGQPNKEYLESIYHDCDGINEGDVVVLKDFCNTFMRNEIYTNNGNLNLIRAQRKDIIGVVTLKGNGARKSVPGSN
jgi:co-chaperonin GroES (HSP10)